MLRGCSSGSCSSSTHELLGVTCPLLFSRDVEYKELQLSLDQVSTSKSQESWRTTLSTSQETRKSAKPKTTKMKTKLRTNPYPPQVTHTGQDSICLGAQDTWARTPLFRGVLAEREKVPQTAQRVSIRYLTWLMVISKRNLPSHSVISKLWEVASVHNHLVCGHLGE